MPQRIPARSIGTRIAERVVAGLDRVAGHELLVSQARRRIMNGGDSDHRYPELWDHPGSFRRGGQPLLSSGGRGGLVARLNGRTDVGGRDVTWTLLAPMHAQYHQTGFETKGPNFIPLTLKAVRNHITGNNPIEEGLKRWDPETGEGDFLMAWQGVKVPQRKIFNLPPEDVEEIVETIRHAIPLGSGA